MMKNGADKERRFSKLVSEYSERLYWHIRSIVVNHEDSDDILQEVFIKVWNSLDSFREEASPFTWLWRIATNESLNFLRWKKVRAALQFSSLEAVMGHESDSAFNGDEVERALSRAIATLPPKQKSVFCMRYYEDLPYEDIAEITGTSIGALKATYHNAREKVEKSIVGNVNLSE